MEPKDLGNRDTMINNKELRGPVVGGILERRAWVSGKKSLDSEHVGFEGLVRHPGSMSICRQLKIGPV